MKSVLPKKKQNNLSLPEMFELVSFYIKLSPIGGRLVALESPVGLSVFVDFIKLCIFPLLFLIFIITVYLPLL